MQQEYRVVRLYWGEDTSDTSLQDMLEELRGEGWTLGGTLRESAGENGQDRDVTLLLLKRDRR